MNEGMFQRGQQVIVDANMDPRYLAFFGPDEPFEGTVMKIAVEPDQLLYAVDDGSDCAALVSATVPRPH
jgi:hypothetical protein